MNPISKLQEKKFFHDLHRRIAERVAPVLFTTFQRANREITGGCDTDWNGERRSLYSGSMVSCVVYPLCEMGDIEIPQRHERVIASVAKYCFNCDDDVE